MNGNVCMFIGRLADNLVYTPGTETSRSRAVGRLIVNRPYKADKGDIDYDVIPLVFWGNQADSAARYTSKGKEISVVGSLKTRYIRGATPETSRNLFELTVKEVSFGQDSQVVKNNKAQAQIESLPPDIHKKYQEVLDYIEKSSKAPFDDVPLPPDPF